jgi:hypothetical protein
MGKLKDILSKIALWYKRFKYSLLSDNGKRILYIIEKLKDKVEYSGSYSINEFNFVDRNVTKYGVNLWVGPWPHWRCRVDGDDIKVNIFDKGALNKFCMALLVTPNTKKTKAQSKLDNMFVSVADPRDIVKQRLGR